jgi:hypothetical protein
MNNVRSITTVLMLAGAVTTFGCQSKQESAATKSSPPAQVAGEVKSISGQVAGGAVATPAGDKADAAAAAARVFGQMEAGEFTAIYQEASPVFKKIGAEAAFVAKFQETRQKTGPFQGQTQTSVVTRPDQTHVLVYRLENDRFKSERRLTFARSNDGKMQLYGLNQHDEAKNLPVK